MGKRKQSKYGKKEEWLKANKWPKDKERPSGKCFGFEVTEPKPWK